MAAAISPVSFPLLRTIRATLAMHIEVASEIKIRNQPISPLPAKRNEPLSLCIAYRTNQLVRSIGTTTDISGANLELLDAGDVSIGDM